MLPCHSNKTLVDETMWNIPKEGDWISLTGKTRHGKNRIQAHGSAWLVLEVKARGLGTQLRLRSASKTEGPRHKKGFDGRLIWMIDDPNFDWK